MTDKEILIQKGKTFSPRRSVGDRAYHPKGDYDCVAFSLGEVTP